MHSVALRALGAAALAVSQTSLTVTENGTYLTEVVLDSVPVTLLVDTLTNGVWVKCTALEASTCADDISVYTSSDYTKSEFPRLGRDVPVKDKRFAEVKIAGQTFHGFDARVVYNGLGSLHPSIQGVLGLGFGGAASMYLDDQVTTVALQLGRNASDSKLSFNTVDKTLLKKKGLTTEVEMNAWITCFQIPFANGSLPTDECSTYSEVTVSFDPASPGIGLSDAMVDTLERRFLYSCTKIPLTRYSTLQFVCNETVKLPRLTVTAASWNFFLDPEDYTTPSTNSSATGKLVNVLVGEADLIYEGLVLGAPFLRKFPANFNVETSQMTMYCAENATCTKVPARQPPSFSPYTDGGGTSGGGGGTSGGGGGGGGYGISVDVEASRKRKKLYLGIGLGVAGVAILAVFGCCCKRNESTDDDAKQEEDVELEVTVEEEKTGSTSSEKTVSGAVKAESNRKKAESDNDSGRGSSSGYKSESSEEERRVLRERRHRRRERRKEEEAKRVQASGGSTTGETTTQEGYYMEASSPKAKPSVV